MMDPVDRLSTQLKWASFTVHHQHQDTGALELNCLGTLVTTKTEEETEAALLFKVPGYPLMTC